MAIKTYNTSIQGEDNTGEIIFELFLFDECSATLKIDTIVNSASLDELFDAIREGVKMLDLEAEDSKPDE